MVNEKPNTSKSKVAPQKKWWRRIQLMVLSSGRNLLPPAINFVLAWWVIQENSEELWGGFVSVLIFISLAGTIVSYGNKEFLLRSFSKHPARIGIDWQESFVTRFGLLLPALAVLVIFFSEIDFAWLMIWLLSQFVVQSMDAVITFTRRFSLAIVAEIGGAIVMVIGLYTSGKSLTVNELVKWWSLGVMVKAILIMLPHLPLLFKKWALRFQKRHLVAAYPFLLIGLSGMLQSRSDLYIVDIMMGDAETGVYQVTISCFLYVQAFAGMVLMPFMANIYRLKSKQVIRITAKFAGLGLIGISLVAIPLIYFVLNEVYSFGHSWTVFLWGGLLVFPIFCYLMLILLLYGRDKEKTVMWVNFAGALINLILTPLLLNVFSLEGAIIASAIAQWSMLIFYLIYVKRIVDTVPPTNTGDPSESTSGVSA